MRESAAFSELKGKTLTRVEVDRNGEEIWFFCNDGISFVMLHDQDCCESVTIEDVDGDIEDLLNSPVLVAEEVEGYTEMHDLIFGATEVVEDSYTWTFYKIDTAKGGVTIRWFGESNGYYSESVDLYKTDEAP